MAGTQFDPVAVEAFVAERPLLRNMVSLKCGEQLATQEFSIQHK